VTKSSAGFPKTAITGIGIAVVLIITLAAGVAYVVHRVRQKAAQAQAQSEFERSLDANNQAAIEDLRKKLIHMARAAPDQKTWAAVEDLINKLSDLERATDPHLNNPWAQTPNKPMSQDEINKSLAEIAAAADSLARNSKQPPTPVDMNKSTTDAAAVANAIEQNANRQPGDIPPSALPPGTSAISVPPSGGFTWKSDGVTYTWNTQGLRLEYSRGANFYSGCPIGKPAPVETPPIAPVAATGNQAHDWALKYERTAGGPEADLVVRTGDINNLGFGWPAGFDPFSGQSTPAHPYPWKARPGAPAGTDRIMVGSSFRQGDPKWDGYSYSADCTCPADWAPCENRVETMPQAVTLSLGALPTKVNAVAFQIFADDFQPQVFHSHFQVSLNGTRIPTFEYAINSLNQTGPIGKLLTLRLLPEYWPLLESGTAKLLIDDPTTHIGDGYAIDFVRILVNPHKFKYQVSLTTTVTDADKHRPIAGATVSAALESAATDRQGKCQLKGIPAGLVVATADAPGYDENSVPVDLVAGQSGNAEIQLHRHQESTAALEQSIAQTGTATIYGIHFDTDSSRIRGDSIPALNAVLGLINGHPGSPWIIAGHTDNQGSVAHNQSLSEARARSVVSWLQQHGVEVKQLAPQGFGASRPVADNATANGRALNRRVEVALEK
jgi:outer membrane protein OmpA-like peptidoglycan-associated protein/type II secretory pathway pseudopilin PulG